MRRVRLAVAIIAVGAVMAGLAVAVDPEPRLLVAFGDSFTAAMTLRGEDPAVSWATGDVVPGGSLGHRLRDAGVIDGAHNEAHSGWRMEQLAAEVAAAPSDAHVVVVFLGINDFCWVPMESTDAFAAHARAGFEAVAAAHPRAHVVVFAITDLVHLHQLHLEEPKAVAFWSAPGYCHHVFAAPGAGPALAFQAARLAAFNQILAAEAGRHGFHYSNATYWPDYTLADFEPDFFHPGLAGQAKMAAAAWPDVQPRRASALTLPPALIA